MATYYLKDRGVLPWLTVRKSARLVLSAARRADSARRLSILARASRADVRSQLGLARAAAGRLDRALPAESFAPEWAAGLAALLTAFDDAHGAAISWLAARHTSRGERTSAWFRSSATTAGGGAAGNPALCSVRCAVLGALRRGDRRRRDRLPGRARGVPRPGALAQALARRCGWVAAAALWLVLYARSSAGALRLGHLRASDQRTARVRRDRGRAFAVLAVGRVLGARRRHLVVRPAHRSRGFVPGALERHADHLGRAACRSCAATNSALFWLCGMLLERGSALQRPAGRPRTDVSCARRDGADGAHDREA